MVNRAISHLKVPPNHQQELASLSHLRRSLMVGGRSIVLLTARRSLGHPQSLGDWFKHNVVDTLTSRLPPLPRKAVGTQLEEGIVVPTRMALEGVATPEEAADIEEA